MQKKLTKILLGYLLFGFLLLGSQTFASFTLFKDHPAVQLVEAGAELSGDQEYNYFPFAVDESVRIKVNDQVTTTFGLTYPAGTVISFVNKAGDLVKATIHTPAYFNYYPIGQTRGGMRFRGGRVTFTINDSPDFKGYFTFGDMDFGETITIKKDEVHKIILSKNSTTQVLESVDSYTIRSGNGAGNTEHDNPDQIVTILFDNAKLKNGVSIGAGGGGVYFGGIAIWKKNESGTLIINHLDSETGLPLADRVVLTGALNTQIALPSPLSISNYDFTGNVVSGHTFANQKPVELNYYYTHKTGSITVNYLTTTATGERKLIDSIVFTGKVGSKILPENKVIPGYLLQTTIQEQEISASDSMVNLYYTLKDPLAAQQENVTITRMRPITELLIKVTGAVQNIQIKNLDQLPGLTYDLITSKISGTTNAAVGVYPLEILATDPYNNTLTVPFTVTVVQGIAPKLDQLPNQTYIRNRPINPLTITGHDDYKISDVRLLSPLPTGLRLSAPHKNSDTLWTYQIEGTPNVARGDYPVELQIDDAEGLSHTMKFLITIRTQSSAPDPTPITPDPQPDPKPDPIPVPTPDPTVVYPDNAVFNPTIFDGQCYTRRPYLGIKDSEKIRTSEEFKKALSFLWSYEMTMYDSIDGYDPYRNLSREEAAKIFSQFAINVLCRKPDLNLHINYTDTENADPTLKPYITLAYQLGVMKGSGMGDGAFRPFDSITKAEINAVLIRMILKSYLDESKSADKKRYSEYNKVSTVLGIITKGAGEETINRNNTALMLFRAYKNQPFEWMNIDYYSFVLKNRADFVK